MFTGFASENTPAIQVWDFFQIFASNSAPRRVMLTDDCAPIQFFRTGGANTTIVVQLPSSPIEGKIIKIIVSKYGDEDQKIAITTSDLSGSGSNLQAWVIGPGQTLDLCYSKNCISVAPAAGSLYSTGWISLNQGSASSGNFSAVNFGHNNSARVNYAAALGGASNSVRAEYAAIVGGQSNIASGTNAFVGGGSSNQASGISSAVIGGTANYAISTRSAAVGGNNNYASGQDAVIIGGATNQANSFYDVVVGGDSNAATGGNSAVIGGSTSTASGSTSTVLGSANSTANGQSSTVVGGRYGTTRLIGGNTVFPANINPIASAAGVSQSAMLLLGRQTTDATATVLTSNTSAATTTNQVILPNNSAYYFKGSITAGVTGAGNSSMWSFEGGIKRGAGVGTTVLIGTPVLNVVAQDAGASTWVVALTADTTNGGLAVTVTGQASTTIRWVCKVETTEMTY
jgi:hypothetical protein